MIRFIRVFPLALLLGAAAWTVQGQGNPQSMNPKNLDTAANPRGGPDGYGASTYWPGSSFGWDGSNGPAHPELYRLWKSLEGRYESNADGTRLVLALRRISPYVLFLQATTELGGITTVERGYLQLWDASVSYTSDSVRYALFFRPETLRSEYGCSLYGRPSPDGITFESEGSDCSFPLGRKVSKLTFQAAAAAIEISEGSGEITALRRVQKP